MASYTIVRGDTLDAIAQRISRAGYPVTYQQLAQRNGIADPNRISAGAVIEVPPVGPPERKLSSAPVRWACLPCCSPDPSTKGTT